MNKKINLLLPLIFLFTWQVKAQSSLYFQGDKSVGIYVKVEGQMMERLSNNFVIVTGLEPGVANFEVLFEQNKYPAQKYKIHIPENGIRGFLITKVDNKNFSLFDIQTHGTIPNKNKEDEAYLAMSPKEKMFFARNITNKEKGTELEKLTEPISNSSKNSPFLEDIDLNKEQSKKKKKEKDETFINEKQIFKTNDNGIVKSDEETTQKTMQESSDNALNEENFTSFANTFASQDNDETRLKYFKKNSKNKKFNTAQLLLLAEKIKGQSTRFEFLKIAKDKVVDPENYANLQSVFSSEFIKNKFLEWLK